MQKRIGPSPLHSYPDGYVIIYAFTLQLLLRNTDVRRRFWRRNREKLSSQKSKRQNNRRRSRSILSCHATEDTAEPTVQVVYRRSPRWLPAAAATVPSSGFNRAACKPVVLSEKGDAPRVTLGRTSFGAGLTTTTTTTKTATRRRR